MISESKQHEKKSDGKGAILEPTHRKTATLENLPTEIVEQIALNLTYSISIEGGSHSFPQALENFRLTSSAVESHIHRLWLRLRFSSLTIDFSDIGFEKLDARVNHAEWSRALRTLRITCGNAMSYQNRLAKERAKGMEDEELAARLAEESDMMKEFTRRCNVLQIKGRGTRLLADALNQLPNLHTVELEPVNSTIPNNAPLRRLPRSSTILFRNVRDAIILSEIQLKAFSVPWLEYNIFFGISENAFDVSPENMERLASLESVSLLCHRDKYTKENSRGCLSKFLQSLPALRELHVGLDTARSKECVIDNFARLTHSTSALQEVCLNGVYISPLQQDTFLASHKDTLRSLTLANCSLSGTYNPWRRLFVHLSTFSHLRHAEFRQVVRDDVRVCFPSTAFVEELDIDHESGAITSRDAWVYLRITSKYHFIADAYQDVPARLQELADDVQVTDEPAMSPGIFGRWFG